MIVHPDLKAAIEDRLKAGWSPEQIAGRMRLERHPIRMSHEAIIGPPIPGTVVTSSPIVTSPSISPATGRVAFAGKAYTI